ncbi:sigma factor [Actinoplanes sp. NPDC051851]|uniref:sigma factor n=1 Tax=Actinoplanes sp. NPDC051851 TaxID=3154753 RepID=UPI00341AF9F0
MSDRDEAFAEYFAARSGSMRATAYLLCGDWHRAEDLTQNAFTKLYLRWHRVDRHEALDPYLRKVLIRSFIDEGWWRRERPQDVPDDRIAAAPELRKCVAGSGARILGCTHVAEHVSPPLSRPGPVARLSPHASLRRRSHPRDGGFLMFTPS